MRAFLIMGPTASGKSALALALAERVGGEVVNADSMQVYHDFRILTARPTPADEARVAHHLYGHIDAAVRFSVGRWLDDALRVLSEIEARGATQIVIGGTGLYFKALTEGLAPAPPVDADVRAQLALETDAALFARLAAEDPESAARIKPNDRVRLLRAAEVLEAGMRLSELHAHTKPAIMDWAGLALTPPRAPLYAAIDARFDAMLAAGALDEVSAVAARHLDPMLPAMKAHGAPALMAHLRGEMSLADAVAIGQRDTRRYAKRQFTWIGHQMPAWTKTAETALDARMEAALDLLR